jgi:hypothetical protein
LQRPADADRAVAALAAVVEGEVRLNAATAVGDPERKVVLCRAAVADVEAALGPAGVGSGVDQVARRRGDEGAGLLGVGGG